MHHYKVMPPCVYWTCKTKKAKGESCKSKNLPEEALKKAIAKAMGLPEFDEVAFMEQVEKIVSVDRGTSSSTSVTGERCGSQSS